MFQYYFKRFSTLLQWVSVDRHTVNEGPVRIRCKLLIWVKKQKRKQNHVTA